MKGKDGASGKETSGKESGEEGAKELGAAPLKARKEKGKGKKAAPATSAGGKDGGRLVTVRFHPETRPGSGVGKRKTGGGKQPAGGGRHINLATQGDTHRFYEQAPQAVLGRGAPPPPPDGYAERDSEEWVSEQMLLTNALLSAYGQAGSENTIVNQAKRGMRSSRTGAYVPKPRKTQRAKRRSGPNEKIRR